MACSRCSKEPVAVGELDFDLPSPQDPSFCSVLRGAPRHLVRQKPVYLLHVCRVH